LAGNRSYRQESLYLESDVGSILMQQLRGLTARGPYFANGSAGDLAELVDFFDRRFKIGLTDKEKQDLVNLLSIL